MRSRPVLRGTSGAESGPWPVGEIPEYAIKQIGRQLIVRLATGRSDISGDEFSQIFANAIDATDYATPLGLADAGLGDTGWSVKTVKSPVPRSTKNVRLISGRNSPDYSFGISDPRADLSATGRAVLAIWNSRLNAARIKHSDIRIVVLIRNIENRSFVIFEDEIHRFIDSDYAWHVNNRNNFEGWRKTDNKHFFTWQPHGGQFTIKREVPGSAIHFAVERDIPLLDAAHIEQMIGYNDQWISIDSAQG